MRPISAYLVYEPPTASRLDELRRRLPARFEEHGFHVSAVQVQRLRASHGLCITGRPR